VFPQTEDDLAYKMVLALNEYGHHSLNKTRDIHIQADNVVLIAVKVSANSSVSNKSNTKERVSPHFQIPRQGLKITTRSEVFLTNGTSRCLKM